MRFVNDRGTLLHVVRDGGHGPAVLFVQGLAGAWFEWDPVVPLLAGDHRLVRFDRPGLGWSQQATDAGGRPLPQSLAGEAERLGRVLDAVGVAPGEKVFVVAHSYGAFHAEAFARLHPERVAGIVFVDASAEPDITPAPGGPGRGLGQAVVRGTRLLGLNQVLGPAVRRLVYQAASTSPPGPGPGTGARGLPVQPGRGGGRERAVVRTGRAPWSCLSCAASGPFPRSWSRYWWGRRARQRTDARAGGSNASASSRACFPAPKS